MPKVSVRACILMSSSVLRVPCTAPYKLPPWSLFHHQLQIKSSFHKRSSSQNISAHKAPGGLVKSTLWCAHCDPHSMVWGGAWGFVFVTNSR